MLKLAKNRAKAKQYPEAEFWLLENYLLSSTTYHHPKTIGNILKHVQKKKYVCLNKVI